MKVAILGGGISGLCAAWAIHKQHPRAKISLFEKGANLGGWIQTRKSGPFQFELGPRTFATGRSKELLRLIWEVGLSEQLIYSDPAAKKRFLLKHGKLCSMGALWPTILKLVIKDLFAKKGGMQDESIASFARRRFGKEAAEQIFDPMALGVYAGNYEKLSVKSSFPFLLDWEQKYGSAVLGGLLQKKSESGLFTLRGGMGLLCNEIANQLQMEIHFRSPVSEIRKDGIVAQGRFHEADRVISALPADEIALLVNEPSPVRMEKLQVVNFGYLGDILPLKGYGYLVPTRENESILGMIWDSVIFPTPDQTKITAMVRGNDPVSIALDAMKRHLKIEKSPDAICSTSAQVPQYELHHADRVEAFIRAVSFKFPNLHLKGNYLHGASVNACVKESLK